MCVTKGTRDPSQPSSGGTFKLSGLPRSGTLSIESIPTDRHERAALGRNLRALQRSEETGEKRRPRKRIDLSFPTLLTSLPLLGGLIISHDRPRMRYGPNIGPAAGRHCSVQRSQRANPRPRAGTQAGLTADGLGLGSGNGRPRGLAGFYRF